MRLCVNCGLKLSWRARVCKACGAPQPTLPAAPGAKKRTALIAVLVGASLLALFAAGSLLLGSGRSPGRVETLTAQAPSAEAPAETAAPPEAPAQTAPAETAAQTQAPVSETQPVSTQPVTQTVTQPVTASTVAVTYVAVPVTERQAPAETPVVPEDPTGPVPAFETVNGILYCGNAAYEYYSFSKSVADDYAAAVNRAAGLLAGRAQVYAMVIPTGIDIALDPRVRAQVSSGDQRQAAAYLKGSFAPGVRAVPVFDALTAHRNEYLYFRTDHHWTGLAAYYAYVEFCRAKGVEPVALSVCARRDFTGFLGSYYTGAGKRAALGDTPDVVETYMSPVNADITVYNDAGRVLYRGDVIYNEDNNSAANKYGAFIFGDNAFSVIENRSVPAGERCLLVKDSFGNALAPLLIANYQTVYVMDFRHCSKTVSQLVSEYGINDVLFADNLSMTRAATLVSQLAAKIG